RCVAVLSPGGNLSARPLAHDWREDGLPQNLIKGAVATSGVYDLEMVMKISVQKEVRMTAEVAAKNSPLVDPPRVQCPLIVAVGAEEPEGWQQMSKNYFALCQRSAIPGDFLSAPNATHY